MIIRYSKSLALALALGAGVASADPSRVMSTTLHQSASMPNAPNAAVDSNTDLVQLALLVDTSGSMKGLVDQARSQLWNVISDLATAKRGASPIRLQIAVYQYGTDRVSKSKGCLRQIVSFTDDLDTVSKGLFSLHVGGGDEFCGEAIASSLRELDWNPSETVYKAIFIAGNEYFDQGTTTFGELLPMIDQNSVFVNTIYCGNKYAGQAQWDAAASIAGGIASLIDHNHHLPKMPTPFDKKMRELNQRMNETFVWYGKGAENAAKNQAKQDKNAGEMSDHAFAARMSTKIGHLYHHIEHDLVDALTHNHMKLDKMPESLMPEALVNQSADERTKFMDEMIARRQTVRREMAEILCQRQRFLENQWLQQGGQAKTVLGDALSRAIQKQASALGYTFGKEASVAKR